MRIGVHLVNFTIPGGPAAIGPTLAAVGAAADRAGVANLSAMDHYLQISGMAGGGADAPMLEGYTTLGYLAGHTRSVELQLLVTGVTYRHPGLLTKIVSTLDVLSGGRAVLGLGAAWYEREHAAYGVPFPPLKERFERLEETLQIVRQMWSDDNGPYAGTHYQLAETINSPQPLATPHPPIMIGGAGERKTLRLLARYGDAGNLFAGPQTGPAQVKAKLDVLAEHCAREGTDYDRIRKTILWTGPLDPDADGGKAFAEQMTGYAQVGIEEVHVMPFGEDPSGSSAHSASTSSPALKAGGDRLAGPGAQRPGVHHYRAVERRPLDRTRRSNRWRTAPRGRVTGRAGGGFRRVATPHDGA